VSTLLITHCAELIGSFAYREYLLLHRVLLFEIVHIKQRQRRERKPRATAKRVAPGKESNLQTALKGRNTLTVISALQPLTWLSGI
jgi:hypothetical protein